MRAAWYERQGPAAEALVVGELPDPEPAAGEVRIALTVSGLSPGDVKKRSGWKGSKMPFPRVIPHSDGAGMIDRVGTGVDHELVGRHVWCYGAQSYRAFGTAAEFVVVPVELTVELPDTGNEDDARVLAEQGACLGIAGITGYRAVFADGSVDGLTVLVFGATGGVGSIATQMARRDGARVIAVVRNAKVEEARALGADPVFADDVPDLAEQIRRVAPSGVQRISEVDFAAHADVDADVLAVGGVVCSYASSAERPEIPYWKFGFADTTIRFLGSDDFPAPVKADAARVLTEALVDGSLRSRIAARVRLEDIAHAHELVGAGADGRIIVEVR